MHQLGKFTDLEEIGRGASARVYKGYHPQLDLWRALKVFSDQSQIMGSRVREAVKQARIDHPGIIQVMDFETSGDCFYMVMEYAPMGTLRDRLAAGKLPPEQTVELAGQIAQALSAAHNKGIWHLDLKPENILFCSSDQVKIGDFGLAHCAGDALDPIWTVGTPNYMAPEQLNGAACAQSDLWALGAILFEMLTCRLCFPGESLSQVTSQWPRPGQDLSGRLAESVPELASPLREIILRLLAVDLEQRYASAREVADDLAALGQGRELPIAAMITRDICNLCPTCKRRIPLGDQFCSDCAGAGEPVPEPPGEIMKDFPPPPSPRRWRTMAGAVTGAVAIGLVALVATVWSPGATDTSLVSVGGASRTALARATIPEAQRPMSGPVELVTTQPEATSPPMKAAKSPQSSENRPVAKALTPRKTITPPRAAPIGRAASAENTKTIPRLKRPLPQTLPPSLPKATAKASPSPRRVSSLAVAKKPAPKVQSFPPAPHRLLALARRSNQVQRAIEAYRAYLRQVPRHAGARRSLALLYWQRGNYRAAQAQLELVLAQQPDDPEARNTLETIRMLSAR